MKTKRSFDILISFAFVGLLGLYVYNHYILPKKVKVAPRPTITKANDILRNKASIPEHILNTTATSSACTLFLKHSAELSMNEYANVFIDHEADKIITTCSGALPNFLQNRINNTISACKNSSRDKISKECYAALIETKIASTAAIIKPDTSPRELDTTILLQLMAHQFNTGTFMEHPEKSLEMLDTLLDKEPDYLNGYKLKLLLLSASSLNKKENYKEMFQETLDEAKRLNSNDPDIKELILAERFEIYKKPDESDVNSKIKNAEMIEYLDAESAKYPKEYIYDYYKANALYNSGNGDTKATIALIENGLKKFPNDTRLKMTLENLKSDDENKRKHPFIISIGFSLNDL
jgi:hypothetical protein